jgi:iron(III) transport system substrate-binding protein
MVIINRRSLLGAGAAFGGAALLPRRGLGAQGDTLTLYNGQHRNTTEALVRAFTEATGVRVTMRNAESPELASQIVEEGGHSPADLFFSEQSPPIASVGNKGLLAPIDQATLQQIPAAYAATDGTWIGATMRTRVIGYNKKMIAKTDLPSSILDVATPRYKDRVAYVKQDGFQEQIMAIVRIKGRPAALDWLRGLKENGRSYNGNRVAMNAVENGEIAMCLTNDYYWFSMAREAGADTLNSALHEVAPTDPGALLSVSAAAILKSSQKQALAQRFLAFLVSEKGQAAMIDTVAEYPTRPGLASPFPLPPLDRFQAKATPAEIGDASEAYALEREAGLI